MVKIVSVAKLKSEFKTTDLYGEEFICPPEELGGLEHYYSEQAKERRRQKDRRKRARRRLRKESKE